MIKIFKNRLKKGFTLIELLAVIAVLAVLIVIATATVTNKVKLSKQKVFIDKVEQYLKATGYENLIADDLDDFDDTNAEEERIYRFPGDVLESIKTQPDGGYIVYDQGKVAVAIWDDNLKLCAVKGFDENTISISETITKKSKCVTVPGETEIDEDILTDNQYQVVFYSNYYHGPQAKIQVINFGVETPLDLNTFEREGYVFFRWSTNSNGSGTRFTDGSTIKVIKGQSVGKTISLYAQWNETSTTLLAGGDLNKKLKNIANNTTNALNSTSDNVIKSFSKSDTPPDASLMNDAHIISVSGCEYPAYAWLDANNNMKWWSQTSNVSLNSSMNAAFENMKKLQYVDFTGLNGYDITTFNSMFNGDSSLTSFNFADIDTSTVKTFNSMFKNCTSLTSLDLRGFDVSSATAMEDMFAGCTGLTSIDVSNWHVEKVNNMVRMFKDCSNLTTINLTSFETLALTNMASMFSGCTKLENLIMPNFNTSKVTNMYATFYNCKNIRNLDLRTFTAEKLTTANQTFTGCSKLQTIDFRNFNPKLTLNLDQMFTNCSELRTITVPANFDESKIASKTNLFKGDILLVGGSGTAYNSSNISSVYARVDNPSADKPGYFTAYSGS